MVNVTSCINDNCVELDWTYGTERDFKYSKLYHLLNRVLGNSRSNTIDFVEQYFNFDTKLARKKPILASMYIQRLSRLRPRDVVVLLKLIQNDCKARNIVNPDATIFQSGDFQAKYSKYYTDQVKSEMMFKYTNDQINDIFGFLRTIRQPTFSEKEFVEALEKYSSINANISHIFPDYHELLNSLYSLDILGWQESVSGYIKLHWHYREVKAIDETYRVPWEELAIANDVRFVVHRGASKHLFGSIRAS